MESIQSGYGSEKIQSLLNISNITGVTGTSGLEQGKQGGQGFDIQLSGLGQILGTIRDSEEVSESDVKTFFDTLHEAMKSGSVDAASLAENAPDWLKSAAEASGIDLETAITEFVENAPPGPKGQYGPPPGPPPEIGGSELDQLFKNARESEDVDEDDIRSFMDIIKESLESGSVDVASLVENAPEWLKSVAEESGVDLDVALEEFLNRFQENSGANMIAQQVAG